MGLPIIPLGGHASQGFVDVITRRVHGDGRPAILLYAGDHDSAGWGILQNFVDRTGYWVNDEQPEWDPDDAPQPWLEERWTS
ncbi:MAG: hypothetical protein ACXWZI_04475 [Mycobacterium sp.]